MPNVLVNEQHLRDIADVIREKKATTDTYKPGEMAEALRTIKGDGTAKSEQEKSISVNTNGLIEVVPDDEYVLTKVSVSVDVPITEYIQPTLQEKTLTENGEYVADTGYDGFSKIIVDVETKEWTSAELIEGTAPRGDILYEGTTVNTSTVGHIFQYRTGITSVKMPNVTNLTSAPNFRQCTALTDLYIPSVTSSLSQGLNSTGFTGVLDMSKVYPALKTVAQTTFNNIQVHTIIFPESVVTVNASAINTPMRVLTTVMFLGTPTTINANMIVSGIAAQITDIYVPWAEGAVANAPWGATNATIHYNTTYDADHNPIV